jgi:hypothetical protein
VLRGHVGVEELSVAIRYVSLGSLLLCVTTSSTVPTLHNYHWYLVRRLSYREFKTICQCQKSFRHEQWRTSAKC